MTKFILWVEGNKIKLFLQSAGKNVLNCRVYMACMYSYVTVVSVAEWTISGEKKRTCSLLIPLYEGHAQEAKVPYNEDESVCVLVA